MENAQVSPDELNEEERRVKARFNLFEAVDPVTTSYLNRITEEQWQMLATAHTDTDTIRLLSGLCQDMVKAITHMVLENALPQVYNMMHGSDSSNTSSTMNEIDAPERDLSYYLIPKEAMECRIWDTLSVSLAEGMGVEEETSHNTDKLLELVAGEVTRRVNQSITDFFYAPSFPPPPQSGGSDISCQSLVDDMVYHTAQILHRCFWREKQEGSQDSEFSEFSGSEGVADSEELNAEDAESISSSPEGSFVPDLPSPYKVPSSDESIDEVMIPIIKSCLDKITEKQWKLLASDNTDTETIRLLSGLCLDIVEVNTRLLRRELFFRVHCLMREMRTCNTSIIMKEICKKSLDWIAYMAIEKHTKTYIGCCLRFSIGQGMGVKTERSENTNKLLWLVAAEVTRRVNLSLAEMFSSTAFPQLHQAVESNIANESLVDDMVYHMIQILKCCLLRKKQIEEGSQEDDPNTYSTETIYPSESSVFTIFAYSGEITPVEEFKAEDEESICSASGCSVLPKFSGPDEVTPVEEFKAEDAESTCSSSDSSVHTFDIMKASHRSAVDVSQKENFTGQKSTGRIFVKKAQRFFRRNTMRVSPACEVTQLENRSTPSPPKKKCPAATGMFFSFFKFTSCIGDGSQDN